MSTYDFSTQQGTPIQVSLTLASANTAFDSYRAEFSPTSNFKTITLTKSNLVSGADYIALPLSSSEVDTLKDCQFRLFGTTAGIDYQIFSGGVNYKKAEFASAGGGIKITPNGDGFTVEIDPDTFPSNLLAAPAAPATPAPPVFIRRFIHVLTTTPALTFDVPVTWNNGFLDSSYNIDVSVLDLTADTQLCSIINWVERGDGTGGTATIQQQGNPVLAVGQHIEIWAWSPKWSLF